MKEMPDWTAIFSAWRASGKNKSEWCRDNGIGYDQFQYWHKKLQRTKEQQSPSRFVPLKVASAPLYLECNGACLHISSGFDPVLLRQVIAALKDS